LRQFDYIIVGQGLAGSIIACLLEMQEKNVVVVDDTHRTSASLAAAGIMNPITGKRLNRPYLVDRLLEIAFDTYPRIERFLGAPIFQRRKVLRLLKSEDESRWWQRRLASGEYAKYLASTRVCDAGLIENKYGAFEIAQAGLLDVPGLVGKTRDLLLSRMRLIESTFDYADLRFEGDGIRWASHRAKAIIFCEGYQLSRNPFFNSIALNPAKGAVLTLKASDFVDERIVQHEKWLLRTVAGEIKTGTTYTWSELNENPSVAARAEIERSLRSFVRFNFEVSHQIAGVRPVVKVDNRPIVGVHPLHSRVAVFNGLGSKGVLQAPFAALQLIAYLEEGEPIHPDFDVCRKSLWK
jgi:glycine/D-amino acid oxidase-like deaminating enzyme